jgi:DNA polymerase-3 subunit alpha
VDLRTVNKRVIESLIFAGAFDKQSGTRAQKHAALAGIMEHAADHKKEQETGQLNLFGMTTAASSSSQHHLVLPDVEPWNIATTLEHEKEVLGLFLTGHPLDVYRPYLNAFALGQKLSDHQNVIRCGMLIAKKVIITKKGDPMAFVKLEYFDRSLEVVVFPKLFKTVSPWLESYSVFAVKGTLDGEGLPEKLKAQDMVPLDLIMQQGYGISGVMLTFEGAMNEELVAAACAELKERIVPGSSTLMLCFMTNTNPRPLRLTTRSKVTVTADLMAFAADRSLKVSLVW